jgi:hypothetical protein
MRGWIPKMNRKNATVLGISKEIPILLLSN